MSILDLLARGVQTSPLDVAKAGVRGTMDRSLLETASLDRQAKQAELDDYLTNTDFRRRDVANKLRLQELEIDKLENPKPTQFSKMQTIRDENNKDIGIGQYDPKGQLFNFKTKWQLRSYNSRKGGKLGTVSKANTKQTEDAVNMLKLDDTIGESKLSNVGFTGGEYKTIAKSIANRAHEIQTQARFLESSINYDQAQSMAKEEFIALQGSAWGEDTTLGIGTGWKLTGNIEYASGLSQNLLDFLGVVNPDEGAADEAKPYVDGKEYQIGEAVRHPDDPTIVYIVESVDSDNFPTKLRNIR